MPGLGILLVLFEIWINVVIEVDRQDVGDRNVLDLAGLPLAAVLLQQVVC
jgi:hypothetical protein